MPADDMLVPPMQYPAIWLIVALAILVVLVVATVLVVALTRPRSLAEYASTDPGVVLAGLRSDFLGRIDEVDEAQREGRLTARQTHATLSRLMREFVNEYSGLEAPVMTLQDLVARGVNPVLIDALGRYTYPSLFRRGAPVDPALAIQAARQVVETWY